MRKSRFTEERIIAICRKSAGPRQTSAEKPRAPRSAQGMGAHRSPRDLLGAVIVERDFGGFGLVGHVVLDAGAVENKNAARF